MNIKTINSSGVATSQEVGVGGKIAKSPPLPSPSRIPSPPFPPLPFPPLPLTARGSGGAL